jgi:hypothetical protein
MRISGILGVVGALFLMLPAQAAPFCVEVEGIPPQCLYADARDCQTRANQLGGICSGNAQEISTPPGIGQYCVVSSGGAAQCIYADRGSCLTDAMRRGGACVQANGTIGGTPDPFRVTRPY